jgi:hypothetical protein
MKPENLRRIWIVRLACRKKEHIARSDEAGWPLNTTLCGISCPAADRTYSKKTVTLSGRECLSCLARLTPKKPSKPSRLLWYRSDKKVHWITEDSRLACGQECAIYGAGWVEMVTCSRCLEMAAKAGVRKLRKSN